MCSPSFAEVCCKLSWHDHLKSLCTLMSDAFPKFLRILNCQRPLLTVILKVLILHARPDCRDNALLKMFFLHPNIHILPNPDAVKSLKKVPERETPDSERKGSTDSEQEDLSFTEKKSYFQRLSLTSDTLPSNDKWTKDVSLDDLPMAEGEIIHEQISFDDKMKMFEPDEGNRKKVQKRDKQDQPTVYRYDFTKNGKDKQLATEFVVSELEKAEEIVKQVSEELAEEEIKISSSGFDSAEQYYAESDSAITLEKVEQEVYSLIDEVNKEEKELSKDLSSQFEDENSFGFEGHQFESTAPECETLLDYEFSKISAPFEKTLVAQHQEESYASQLEVEEKAKQDQEESSQKSKIDADQKDELHKDAKLNSKKPLTLPHISSAVDSHIKSEILQEELDQSIEESPLEVKHIVDDLEKISASEDHKSSVYKQIRTEIFTQELGADIESGSPERKELGAFSMKKSDSISDSDGEQPKSIDNKESAKVLDANQEKFQRKMSPQASEDHTDEISSESAFVEPDEHLIDYDELRAEHSLTEQLQALASDSTRRSSKNFINDPGQSLDFASHREFEPSGMSSSLSDLEMHRRVKDISYSYHDKKEIRSLKSTKQVSTIEEHSSIESCDSPQDLGLHDLPEKSDTKSSSDEDDDDKPKKDNDGIKESLNIQHTEIAGSSKSFPEFKEGDQIAPDPTSSLVSDLNSQAELSAVQKPNFTKSPQISGSDSKSSHSKKSDSETEGLKVDSSGDSGGKTKGESCSSSGDTESPYYSVETSDSGRTPRSTPAASRPCSSEFDINVFSGHGSEYETCVTSQGTSGEGSGSYATAISSQEISYATACSSFSHSSRESAHSVDSESSGHLASVEVSSEASETLVPSAQEMELEFPLDLEMPVLDEEPANEEDSIVEPYDMDIPEAVIRGGIEMPFMKNWEMKESDDDEKLKQLPQQWMWQFAKEKEVPDEFETLEAANAPESQMPPDVAEESSSSEKKSASQTSNMSFPHGSSSHRRSLSSVVDIVPDKEFLEQSAGLLDEEQLSISESSATHSEQTWQTSSIDTAVQISHAQGSSVSGDGSNVLLDSFQEIPENELIAEVGFSSNLDSSYLQLNGPVEVDYNPDYDNPEGSNSELVANQIQSSNVYENEGLQFELEMEGSPMNLSAVEDDEGYSPSFLPASGINNHENNQIHENNHDLADYHTDHSSVDYELQNASATEADKPEAQQQQSMAFDNYDHHESESLVCSDLTSYLPESDQGDLLSGILESLPPSFESEMNIPCAESVSSSDGLHNLEARSNLLSDLAGIDAFERTDAVDTSPEDERYEYKSKPNVDTSSPKEDNLEKDFRDIPSKSRDSNVPESEYMQQLSSKYDESPSADLCTHHEEFDLRYTHLSPIPSVGSKQSTPSSDFLQCKRFFPKSTDTSAASSLQEFERLEADIAAGRISRSSIESGERAPVTKSGEHDDVSMCSLTEFEKLEKECQDSAQESKSAIPDVMMLSEIEEGLESLQESLHEGSDSSEYERRRIDLEEVIKVAQSNVEKFQEETASEGITSDECTVLLRVGSDAHDTSEEATKASSKEDGNTDFEDSEQVAITLDADNTIGGNDSSSSGERNCEGRMDCMVSSTDSMDPSGSTATHATYQFETDSAVSSSLNSAQASGEECTVVSSSDTVEPEAKLTYSQGEIAIDDRGCVFSQSEDATGSSKGALESKLKELQATNGAKQQMEMFLSNLTDDTVLMDDFTSHSFPDTIDDCQPISAPDHISQSIEATQEVELSGESLGLDPDLVSSTTTTRVVTSVVTDSDDPSQIESSTIIQQLYGDDGFSQHGESGHDE